MVESSKREVNDYTPKQNGAANRLTHPGVHVMSNQPLFTPYRMGDLDLPNRIVMAPLTRNRSEQPGDIPGSMMLEYYTQRASDGGLIVSEATSISAAARGWFGAPGMYSDQQVEGWKKIVDAVHARGSVIFSQLWHTGRSSHIATSGHTPVSASVSPAYWADKSHLVLAPDG